MSLRFQLLAIAALSGIATAQDPAPTRTATAIDEPNIRQTVTAVLLSDGKLGLIGSDRTRVAFMPSFVVLTAPTGHKMVIRDGRITELAGPSNSFGTAKIAGAETDLRFLDESAQKAGVGTGVIKIYVRSIALTRDGAVRAIGSTSDVSIRDPGDYYYYTIPSGAYTGVAGTKTIIVNYVSSRPTQFLLPGATQGIHEVNEQPVPVVLPIRR